MKRKRDEEISPRKRRKTSQNDEKIPESSNNVPETTNGSIIGIIKECNQKRIILASKSPRRKDILNSIGLKFEINSSKFEENLDKVKLSPKEYVLETAKGKANEVAARLKNEEVDLIVSADTVVSLFNTETNQYEIMEKPKDLNDAFRIISNLSGKCHSVFTGVYLNFPKIGKIEGFVQETKVYFDHLSSEEIWKYIETKEPMDKAGGYGIQGRGGMFINKIEG